LTAADETWIEAACVVPEPSTLALLMVACVTGLWFRMRSLRS